MRSGEELVNEIWTRWNAGARDLDPELFDPELVIHSVLTGDTYRGFDEARRWMSEIDDQFERWRITIDEISEVEPDRYLVLGGIKMRGRESGVDLDQPAGWVVTLRDGHLLALHNFIGHDAARDAAEADREQPS